MDDNISFANMDSWKGGSNKYGITFKQIILSHINRCVTNGSCEWMGGYYKEQNHGSYTSREYVPDSRDVFNNSIAMLRALLLGYFDNEMESVDKKLKEDFEKTYSTYKDESDKEKIREWYKFKIKWHITLFEELIKLAKRLNFMEEESIEEEV